MGRQIDVPLLAGWNGEEGLLFRHWALPHSSAEEFRTAAAARFGEGRPAEFLKVYPAGTDAEAKTSAETLIGDIVISQQVWEWLQLHRRTGQSPVYGYQFNMRSPYTPIPAHASEIDYVFGTLEPHQLVPGAVAPGPRDQELAEQMMSYWVNFAQNGDPNGSGLPYWPGYQINDSAPDSC